MHLSQLELGNYRAGTRYDMQINRQTSLWLLYLCVRLCIFDENRLSNVTGFLVPL